MDHTIALIQKSHAGDEEARARLVEENTFAFSLAQLTYENIEEIEEGIWNVAETREGDHGTVIGLNAKKGPTVEFYTDLFGMIEELR